MRRAHRGTICLGDKGLTAIPTASYHPAVRSKLFKLPIPQFLYMKNGYNTIYFLDCCECQIINLDNAWDIGGIFKIACIKLYLYICEPEKSLHKN